MKSKALVSLVMFSCVASVAVAEEGQARRAVGRMLEEVVVTTQKYEENQQEVPISISSFSGDNLEARGVCKVKALGQITPAVQFTEFAGYTLIYIRCVGTDAWIPSADPSVATYVDGIHVPSSRGVVHQFGGV